jgi:hypothetical protein
MDRGDNGGMIVPNRRAHLAGGEIEDFASGVVPYDGPFCLDEEVWENVTAVTDQILLRGIS